MTVQERAYGHSKKPAGLGFINAIVRTWLRYLRARSSTRLRNLLRSLRYLNLVSRMARPIVRERPSLFIVRSLTTSTLLPPSREVARSCQLLPGSNTLESVVVARTKPGSGHS